MTCRTEAQQNPKEMVLPGTGSLQDTFIPLLPEEVTLRGGFLGTRVDANEKKRLLAVDENDLLDAFERREVPHQDWQGEHVGKFLHAATLAWNYSHDPRLKTKIDRVVVRLLKTQQPDGYLGSYSKEQHWTSWDVWAHKYNLIGLITYYQFTRISNNGEPTALGKQALDACRKVGDLLIATFGTEPGKRNINWAGEHVGMAADSVLEPIVLLYRATREKRYLDFAHYIVTNYDAPGGPAILASLESKKSVQAVANAKAYEMTSNFNGLLELYRVSGEKRLLDLMKIAWDDIVRNRLYVTGSTSANERFQDDYHLPNQMNDKICETCVTVTWEQMNIELLRLTGDARYAQELEKSVYNHLLAAQKPTGDDWAYYTPLEGYKPYDHVTTCCHSSGPRGVALIPVIACMVSADGGLVMNFYNSGTFRTHLKSGNVSIQQTTRYPLQGQVSLTIVPEKDGQKFPLRLRIPSWTPHYTVILNKKPFSSFKKNLGYIVLDRKWQKQDVVQLKLSIPDRLVIGDHENAGKAVVMHGPLVLALDSLTNGAANVRRLGLGIDPAKPISLISRSEDSNVDKMAFTFQGTEVGGGKTNIILVPYARAGGDGRSYFRVWIPLSAPNLADVSLLSGSSWSASRRGNVVGEISDDDTGTFATTFDNHKQDEDWFAVYSKSALTINRIVFVQGPILHDGGWFDTESGTHAVEAQVQTERNGAWKTVATFASYPKTSATDAAGLHDKQSFDVIFPSVSVFAVRVLGKPACGDSSEQAFLSCAELQVFHTGNK